MALSFRILSTLLATSALALGGCTSLLGDFTYDANGNGHANGGSGGGVSAEQQGDIVVEPTTGLITTEQGLKAYFSIVLKKQPTATVAIALSSSNEKEGTVSPSSVTFTPDNYAAPQMVQITGVDDDLPDGSQNYTIKTSPATSEDAFYHGIDPLDPQVRNVDDDTAGFLLMPAGGLVTTESGGEATFTLALTHAPSADVVIPLSSDKPTEGTVSPASLTFTSVNWMAPQVVTVTGVNDDAADGAQTYHVVTGPASSMDQGYDKLDPDDETITNQDNDTAGVTLSPETGLVTFENGAMTTFGIALNSPPSKDVSIVLSSSNEAEGTVSPPSVTFTSLNWMAPQVVTVTGVDDTRADGNQPYSIVTSPCQSDDLGYSGLDGPDAQLINVDDDSPGLVVTPTIGLVTREDGMATTFTVALQSKPAGDVLLDLTSARPTEGVVSPATLAFTEVNWNAPQTVTVTGVDDKVADGMQTYVVHVAPNPMSADPAYVALNEVDVNLSNTDDDSAGITVVAAQGLTTTEGGGSATFTIALNSQPTMDVSIALSSNDTSEGTVSPATLVFTHDNYLAPQTVTIKGVNDDMQDGNQPYRILTAPAVSNDAGYSGMDATNVELTNIDDDSAGITVSAPNQPLMTSENGGSATFTVVLNSQPASGTDVNVPVQSSNPAEGTVSVSNLKFTTDNWRAPQTVTVKGVEDDGTADGSQQYQVWLLQAASMDPHYSVINPPNVNLVNVDNDTPGITLKNMANLFTGENGSMASFQIVLNSKPTADVNIGLSSSKPAEGTVTPPSLKFTGTNWNAPQNVTITGVDDKVADGSQIYRVVTAAAVSADLKYNGIDPTDPQVTNIDNDSPGISVVYQPLTGLTTTENGGTATFSITLNSQPTADVVIPVHSDNKAEGTVGPANLTFTAANWNSPHMVTLTGADDSVADGKQPYNVITDPAQSGDPQYNKLDATDVPAFNVDNDSAGITVGALSGDTKEDGTSASFNIVLNSQPRSDVTIALSSDKPKEGSVSPASVTFTALDWAAPHKVTVTGVDDKVADGKQSYEIVTAPATSMDKGYAGMDAPDVTVFNVDNDSAGVTVSAPKGKTKEDGTSTTFSIVLNSQPTADVTITFHSDTPSEGTTDNPSQVVFTTSNYNSPQNVTVTGVDDDAADGEQGYKILFDPAVGGDYKGIIASSVQLFNVDDDSAGLTVTASAGTTSEKQTTPAFQFKIALTSKPSSNVTIPISIDAQDAGEGTVSPASLLFTTDNWKALQTVTIKGVDDAVADGDQTYPVHIGAAVSTDPGYKGFDANDDVTITNDDDDSAGVEVGAPDGHTSEAGAPTTFSVVLSSQPTADVVINVKSLRTTECTVSPASLKFTTTDWSTPQKINVHGEDDHVVDGDQSCHIQVDTAAGGDATYNAIDPDDVFVINDDNDSAGISVTPTSDQVTTEAGGSAGSATFSIVLDSQPADTVSMQVNSQNELEGTVDKPLVTFTVNDWSKPQIVTVTGVDDDVADGDQSFDVKIEKVMSADDKYSVLPAQKLTFLNKDNDSPSINVTPPPLDMRFTGEAADAPVVSFSVVLNSAPTDPVTIPVTSLRPTEGEFSSPAAGATVELVFDAKNWNKKQTVTVVGVDDADVDGDQTYDIEIGPSESMDGLYNDKMPAGFTLTNVDDDAP